MRRRLSCLAAALAVGGSVVLVAQARPRFEVVSIKPTQPGSRSGPGPVVQTEPGHLIARGTLSFFIEYAYGVNSGYVDGGPAWLRSDRYDIDARQGADAQSFATMPVMTQTALADRFKLVTHRETRETPVLLLMVSKGGSRLTRSAPTDDAQTRGRPGEIVATKITMAGLASVLSRNVGRMVLDRTGLDGFYNITLHATNDVQAGPDRLGRTPVDPDAPSIGTALEEQLGLRLESGRGPVEFLVIDRAERPATN